jgi:hypothetical protein
LGIFVIVMMSIEPCGRIMGSERSDEMCGNRWWIDDGFKKAELAGLLSEEIILDLIEFMTA